MSINPSEDEVVDALRTLRQAQPSVGKAKLLAQLKEENPCWALSEKRLKNIMRTHGIGTATDCAGAQSADSSSSIGGARDSLPRSSPRPHLKGWSVAMEAAQEKLKPLKPFGHAERLGMFPWKRMSPSRKGYQLHELAKPDSRLSHPLLHQLDYMKNSDRVYRIYGRGECDWGFTPNSDMGILFDIMRNRAIKDRDARALLYMYQRLLAAARQVDVSAADLRAQLHAEYGFDPLLTAPRPPSSPEEFAAWRAHEEKSRLSFREKKLNLMKQMWKGLPEVCKFIELDLEGVPVYREERDGIDAVFCISVDKGDLWRMA